MMLQSDINYRDAQNKVIADMKVEKNELLELWALLGSGYFESEEIHAIYKVTGGRPPP